MLGELDAADQVQLVAALETAERLLAPGRKPAGPAYMLRPHQPGDLGWIIHRHGALYAEEYGLDQTFEALVARIAAAFIENFDAARERCWIAERQGAVAGAVLLSRRARRPPNCAALCRACLLPRPSGLIYLCDSNNYVNRPISNAATPVGPPNSAAIPPRAVRIPLPTNRPDRFQDTDIT
jgi:hypothetical protein